MVPDAGKATRVPINLPRSRRERAARGDARSSEENASSLDCVSRSQTPAYAAFAWALVFMVPHLYWALGGTAGLGDESIEGVLAVINYAGIVLSIVAAALALALVRPLGASVSRRLLLVGAWGACVLLSLRGGVGLIQDIAIALGASDEGVPALVLIFEPLFLIGGILFGLAARQYAGAATRR